MAATITHSNPKALHKVYENLAGACKRVVAVGFPQDKQKAYPDGTSVASVAAWNVYGVPSRGIPARDFMGKARPDIISHQKDVVQKINNRTLSEAGTDTMLKTLGEYAMQDIQNAILATTDPPNADSTIAKKMGIKGSNIRSKKLLVQAKAAGSSHPLIDTGLLIGAISATVRDKE